MKLDDEYLKRVNPKYREGLDIYTIDPKVFRKL